MRVKCKYNKGENCLRHTKINIPEYTDHFNFPIETQKIYIVYGIILFEKCLHFLLLNPYNNLPEMYPADLFEIEDGYIPLNYFCRTFHHGAITYLMGNNEFVNSKMYLFQLLNRNKKIINHFMNWKLEVDELLKYQEIFEGEIL